MPLFDWCLCRHPIDQSGHRVFLAGAYVDEEGFWRCGYCKKVIPMTPDQKFQYSEENKNDK